MPSSESGSPATRSEAALLADALLADLNPEQRAAAAHGDGPLLIVAGAGTGKTATLAHRVAHLIARGADPGRILLLTFTRRAASEMVRRVDGLLRASAENGGPQLSGARVWGGTFHAIAARLLRIHARDLGMEPDFTIMDRGDSEDLMHLCRTELGLGRGSSRFPQKSTCLDIYSRCVNAQLPLAEVLRVELPVVPRGRGRPRAASSRSTPTRRKSSRCSTTTTCCCSGTACSPIRSRASACASASTTCSSTSTRTPTCSKPRSSRCCAPTAPA